MHKTNGVFLSIVDFGWFPFLWDRDLVFGVPFWFLGFVFGAYMNKLMGPPPPVADGAPYAPDPVFRRNSY